ncbi:MAG: FAD-dependent monooxygenase, partial [Herbaspirillum sp.]
MKISPMLRLTNLALPLRHTEADLEQAICARLGIQPTQLIHYSVFRRSYDARKKTAISLHYTLDVELDAEVETALQAPLSSAANNPVKLSVTPDTSYHFVAHAPDRLTSRPIVIGSGPCGLFAGLLLAQMGFHPIILERGKEVRQRTKDTFGLWRQRKLE